jgi:hypothetical protein
VEERMLREPPDRTLPRRANVALVEMLDSVSDWPGFEMMQTGCL